MAVYVDDMMMEATVPNGARPVRGRWCHLTADTEEELHRFAARIGMRRAWFQPQRADKNGRPRGRFHYDVVESRRDAALRLGAVPLRCGSPAWMDLFSPGWRDDERRAAVVARRDARQPKETDVADDTQIEPDSPYNPDNPLTRLFGPPRRPDPEARYVQATSNRDWGAAEHWGVLPLLVPCMSDRAYIATARWLVSPQVLDRPPVEHQRKSRAKAEVDIIEQAFRTNLMRGGWGGRDPERPEIERARRVVAWGAGLPCPRTGAPWTWFEEKHLLRKWLDNTKDQPRVTLEQLLGMMGRGPDDAPAARRYLRDNPTPPAGRARRDPPEDLDAPYPAAPASRAAALAALNAFRAAPPADRGPLWCALHALSEPPCLPSSENPARRS